MWPAPRQVTSLLRGCFTPRKVRRMSCLRQIHQKKAMVSFLQSTNTVPSPQHLLNRWRALSPLNEDSVTLVMQGIWKKERLHVVSCELLSLCQPHIPSRQAPGRKSSWESITWVPGFSLPLERPLRPCRGPQLSPPGD